MKPVFNFLPRFTLALIFAALCVAAPQPARADHFEPDKFIADLGDRAIRTLADVSFSPAYKKTKFRELFLEGFDIKTLGRFAVGRYWRKANKAQRSEYRKLFTKYIVQTYSARFSQYSGQTLRVVGRRPVGKNDTIVKTQLIRPQGAPVRIEWRVRDRKHKFLIIDIIVEGVSMAITQRDEFSSVIRRGGGDFNTLLTVLREKIGS